MATQVEMGESDARVSWDRVRKGRQTFIQDGGILQASDFSPDELVEIVAPNLRERSRFLSPISLLPDFRPFLSKLSSGVHAIGAFIRP